MPVTGASDYTDDAFDAGNGYYLVTYGGDPAPKGPYKTVTEMAEANDLRDYPDDGYVVEVAQGWIGIVPSLNPDDLLPPSVRHLNVTSSPDVRESCGSCNADIGPSRSFPWHYENEDCRAIRDPITPTITRDDIKLHFREDDGSVVLSVKDVDVVQIVLHGFWNGNDDYYMTADDENCPSGGFMVASWRYDRNDPLLPNLDPAENGEYTRLWSQPLPEKVENT